MSRCAGLFLHALASHFFFHLENPCQQLSGHLFGLEFESAIQEPGLGSKVRLVQFVER